MSSYENDPFYEVFNTPERDDTRHPWTCDNEACGSDLLRIPDDHDLNDDCFVMCLQCANCQDTKYVLFDDDGLEDFDIELDRGTQMIVEAIDKARLANGEEEVDRFAAALAINAILPEDFKR